MKVVNDKLKKLYADFMDMALHLKEKFYHHLLTIIFDCQWLLTHVMKLAITKYMHSFEYLSALGTAIRKAIKKGMQDGLAAGITQGAEEDNLRERLGLTTQPCVDQLMVPIHHSSDKVVVGATSLSFALYVSDARVRKIRENIARQRPTLRDVFTPISEPFSTEVLTGTAGTSDTVPASITMALSVTSISACTIPPISTDDFEIAHTEDGEDVVVDVEAVADEGADPFPYVSGAKLDVPE
nr:hypothetical protein [Tanacetum cinerariifolium]